jgi:hypothetical protein
MANDDLRPELAYSINGVLHSFVMLTRCLERSGTLPNGRFQKALRDTFNDPDADFARADYQFFASLLRELEQDVPQSPD